MISTAGYIHNVDRWLLQFTSVIWAGTTLAFALWAFSLICSGICWTFEEELGSGPVASAAFVESEIQSLL
jgi:hypothetical protein